MLFLIMNISLFYSFSLFDHRYIPTALFFKAMQGFLESGPQATLQLSLLFFGSSSKSKHMLIDPHLPTSLNQSIFDDISWEDAEDYRDYASQLSSNESLDLDIFGRVYDKGMDLFYQISS